MSRRREHGRIASVETMVRGGSLDADAAAGATSLLLVDAGDFDEDGGTLAIGMVLTGGEWDYSGAQLVEYVADDETGILTLTDPLTAAAERGDPVHLWDPLYDEAVEYQEALVELDGDEDNPEEVVAEVAEGVDTLPEGDRGRHGESCTLKRISDDEWEVVAVGGRSRRSKSLRAEADDFYVLTAADITAGVATIPLSHRPVDEWLIAVFAGVPQQPTNYSIDYDAQTITWPLDGWEPAGAVIWVHYAYRKGVATPVLGVPFASSGWAYLTVADSDATDRSSVGFDDSSWTTAPAPFGASEGGTWTPGGPEVTWPAPATTTPVFTSIWLRRALGAAPSGGSVKVRADGGYEVWWNGTLIGSGGESVGEFGPFAIPATPGVGNVLAVRLKGLNDAPTGNNIYLDVEVTL